MDLTGISTPVIAGAVIFTGLVVVFVALVGLWVIVAAFGKIFISLANRKKPEPPTAPPASKEPPAAVTHQAPQPPVMQIEAGVSGEIIAVIAAAISAMSGGTEVIHSVQRVRQARSNWAQAGLIQNTQQF